MHVKAKLLADALDVLETLLVVGAGTTDPDLDLVLNELGSNFSQGADDALEGGGDVGEVGNATADEEYLAFGVLRSTQHQVKDGAGVVERLRLRGRTRVLAIVGKLPSETSRCDGISIHHRRPTTRNQGPDTADSVENGELEGSTRLGIHLGNVRFFLAHLPTKGGREVHGGADIDGSLGLLLGSGGDAKGRCAASNGPLGTALKLGRLVNLGGKIEKVNVGRRALCVGNDDKGIDLEVACPVC